MLVELGNHAPHRAIDEHPCLTSIFIPDPDENGLGGYTHEPGLSAEEFRRHHADAITMNGGITRLPDHEALLSIVNAWPQHGREAPRWVNVIPQRMTRKGQITAEARKQAGDLEAILRDYYRISADKPGDLEDRYHTRWGAPGEGPRMPEITNLFTNDGRAQQAVNYAGGQVGDTGQATASSATGLTTTKSYTLNQFAGYRVYATVSGSQMVWGNILSNTAGPNSVLTVDRWYNPAAPGGGAGSTPSATAAFLIADGGVVSAWFVGLSTTNIVPAATDHSLSGEYTAAGGGLVRKIAPYSLTSGTSPVTFTLTPVYTANASDVLPSTFYAAGVFVSMVVSATTLMMKFEANLSASQTLSASGDQLTVTLTETGS